MSTQRAKLAKGVFLIVLVAHAAGSQHAAAQDSQAALSRIAFGSCAHQNKPQPIWESIIATKPELFLFIGDNIYGDTKDMKELRARYQKLAEVPGYQKLLKTCPLLATWDDHDYGWNDAGADWPHRKESQQIFLDFFGIANDSPRRTQEGIYSAAAFGPSGRRVQVILLDTRYHRSPLKKRGKFIPGEGPYVPNTDPNTTMLGETQWRWLEEQLKVPADLRLLVSSIQVVAEDHAWEKWMNFPHERGRLYKLLKDTGAAGVVILSGDRHLAELSLMDAGIGYPLYDLTSSGLNQGNKAWRKQEKNTHRVATMNFGNNFGLITVAWDKKDPVVSLQVRDEDGDITIQQKIPLSLLKPGAIAGRAGARARLASGEPITPELVKKLLGEKVTIEIEVEASGASATSGLIFLNSEENRLHDDNFTVVLEKTAQAKLKDAGISDIRGHFEGKTIRVSGVLSTFRDRPQIVVSDVGQIEIKKK
jgi:alkaline phosphatase D